MTKRLISSARVVENIRKIDGQFALVSIEGKTIRMARSIGRPLRYFIAKRTAGPELVIAAAKRSED